jgi:cobalt-zinc-cadmium resistance protein CzcA
MIEKILCFSINYPFRVLFAVLALAAFGVYSFSKLPIDAVPDITNNQVQINTLLPGFSPPQMEKQATYEIENALAGIPGLTMTRSLTRNGFSQVTAIFDDNIDIYFARQQINERLTEAKEHLPDGAEPTMGPISTGLGEIFMWSVDYQHPNGNGVNIRNGQPGWQSDGSYLTPEDMLLTTDFEKASYFRTGSSSLSLKEFQDLLISTQSEDMYGNITSNHKSKK